MGIFSEATVKLMLIFIVFLSFWGIFLFLFAGSQIQNYQEMGITDFLSASWEIFTQPELIIFNAIFGIIGVVIALLVVRENLQV